MTHKIIIIYCYTSIPLRDAIWSFHANWSVGKSFLCKKQKKHASH